MKSEKEDDLGRLLPSTYEDALSEIYRLRDKVRLENERSARLFAQAELDRRACKKANEVSKGNCAALNKRIKELTDEMVGVRAGCEYLKNHIRYLRDIIKPGWSQAPLDMPK
jgi:hypothetical protein